MRRKSRVSSSIAMAALAASLLAACASGYPPLNGYVDSPRDTPRNTTPGGIFTTPPDGYPWPLTNPPRMAGLVGAAPSARDRRED